MDSTEISQQKLPTDQSDRGLSFYCSILNDICQEENITITWLSNGWLALLEQNDKRHFVMGYKFDLNPAIAADIADDKFATFDVLSCANIPVIHHALLYEIDCAAACAQGMNSLDYVRNFMAKYDQHIVIKPNNGTRGSNVYEIRDEVELEPALKQIFHQSFSASMCPFYRIKHEYRLIMLDDEVKIAYRKERGDDWRFNLRYGAKACEIKDEMLYRKLVEIAIHATRAVGLRFCSVDIIETADHELLVLEVNSGVMVDGYLTQHPDKYKDVYGMYRQAVQKMFEDYPNSMLK